ncbi:hypothetical protein HN031_11660 [Nocardioides sp. zg-1308]|uniref:Uncharacterized protein n=1 Tax=Nocardioides renjunii TaxID=3095075 RepID=A0ABU5KH09_9ACTN|nr:MULTISPECIES: hypothetical protein [unclassified Nocardioides]MDZ5664166.1 hypothetical protein [Nocardioides sp. S-58]NPD05339.1 hypothetical protein [Nocardioides sp. zg-1308]
MLPLEDRELLNQTMVGLNIDPETISSLMASFDKAAEGVESKPITPVQSSSFGESYTGGYRLGTNAEMAHKAVAEELKKVAAGLRGMGSSVEAFRKDMETTTEQTTATMNLIQASTDCVAAPDFSSNQCTLPTEED